MRGFMNGDGLAASRAFDAWLCGAVEQAGAARAAALDGWADAPGAAASHPREEHLIPLMIAAGAAADEAGAAVFTDVIMGAQLTGIRFG